MEIRKLCMTDKAAFERFEVAMLEDKKTNPFVEWSKVSSFEAFLSDDQSSEVKKKEQTWSTFSRFYGFIDGEIAGFVSCFWEMEHPTCQRLGHMGYMVAPSFRGKGIATELVEYGLERYREKGVPSLYIAMEEDNIASRKTAEKIGGHFLGIDDIDYQDQKLTAAKYEVRL